MASDTEASRRRYGSGRCPVSVSPGLVAGAPRAVGTVVVAWWFAACTDPGGAGSTQRPGPAGAEDTSIAVDDSGGPSVDGSDAGPDAAPADAADTAGPSVPEVVDSDGGPPTDVADASNEPDAAGPDSASDAPHSDAAGDDVATADTSDESLDADPVVDGPPVVVIAGDSWSSGLVGTLPAEVAAFGLADVEFRWEYTANAGSQARTWRENRHPPALGGGVDEARPRMLDALRTSLDEPTPADVLVLVLSGNDFNRECADGWGEWARWRQELALDAIEADLASVVDTALEGRPGLEVVLVGYDYFHFEFLRAFGLQLDGLDTNSYNEGLIELGRRQRAVAAARPQVHYANNYGILQHIYGDRIHPPFSRPNPLTGYPEYGPGIAPRPTGPPDYAVYPGGFFTYPAPLDAMPDGIHPSPEAMGAIIRNTLDQVLGEALHRAVEGDEP